MVNPTMKDVEKEKEDEEADKLAKLITDTLLNTYVCLFHLTVRKEENSNETSDQMKERVLLVEIEFYVIM